MATQGAPKEVTRGIAFEITSQLDSRAAEIIAQWIGCFGVVWNCKVAENKAAYQAYLQARDLDNAVCPPCPDQKAAHFQTEERPWLGEVPSQIRRNAAAKWREAVQAGLRGIRSFPTFRKAGDKKNCCVTKELFELAETQTELRIGLRERPSRTPFCWVRIERRNELGAPKSLWLRRQGARFWISWSYTVECEVATPEDIVAEVSALSVVRQEAAVLGIDMGVKAPVATSSGDMLGFSPQEARALRRHEKKARRLNKALARKRREARREQQRCGSNYRKRKQQLGERHALKANVRKNVAHRISKRLAEEPQTRIVVAEQLNIKGMVRKPKAKRDEATGRWERNGARAKAGLNKSILNVGWGSILDKLAYKLEERDKLLVRLDPKYSSQQCEKCGHVATENRKTQAEFVCVACGHEANADTNAAKVLKSRFLEQLRAGTFALKAKTAKKIAPRRKQASQEADRVAVSLRPTGTEHACGADVRPLVKSGSGREAGSRRGNSRQAGACSGSSVL
jgi:putative transposase